MNELEKKYERLDQVSRTLLQIVAFQHDQLRYDQLAKQASSLGLWQSDGRALPQSFVKESLAKWTKSGLLTGRPPRPPGELLERLIRDGLDGDHGRELAAKASVKPQYHWMQRDSKLDFYVAFYEHNADAWKDARRNVADGSVPLMTPFCRATFDGLPSELKCGFFDFVIPAWIATGSSAPEAVLAMRDWMDGEAELPAVSLPRLFEWAVASGDQDLLTRISSQTGGKMDDIEGCRSLLKGKFDEAFSLLSKTLSNRASKRTLTKLGGLPSLLSTLAAVAGHASVGREEAFKATVTARAGRDALRRRVRHRPARVAVLGVSGRSEKADSRHRHHRPRAARQMGRGLPANLVGERVRRHGNGRRLDRGRHRVPHRWLLLVGRRNAGRRWTVEPQDGGKTTTIGRRTSRPIEHCQFDRFGGARTGLGPHAFGDRGAGWSHKSFDRIGFRFRTDGSLDL